MREAPVRALGNRFPSQQSRGEGFPSKQTFQIESDFGIQRKPMLNLLTLFLGSVVTLDTRII